MIQRPVHHIKCPPDTSGRPVDPKQHQSVLPGAVILLDPHIGVPEDELGDILQKTDKQPPVSRAGDDPVSPRRPVDASHPEVVLVKTGLLLPARRRRGVDGDVLGVMGEGNLEMVHQIQQHSLFLELHRMGATLWEESNLCGVTRCMAVIVVPIRTNGPKWSDFWSDFEFLIVNTSSQRILMDYVLQELRYSHLKFV